MTAQDWAYCADLLSRGAFEELFLRSFGPTTDRDRAVRRRHCGSRTKRGTGPRLGCRSLARPGRRAGRRGRGARAAGPSGNTARPPRAVQVDDGVALLLAFAQLLVARQAGDMKAVEAAYAVLVEHDPQGPFGTFARYEMGSLFLWQGSDQLGDRHLHQALKQATAQSLNAIALRCVGRLAILHCSAGRVSLAEDLIGQGTTLLEAHPWIPESFRVAYHLGAAEVAMMRGDQDLHSRFIRLVDAELAPKADPALSCMTALIQTKALQTAGRYAEAHQLLQTNPGRQLPAAWLLGPGRRSCSWSCRHRWATATTSSPSWNASPRPTRPPPTEPCWRWPERTCRPATDAANRVVRRIITSHHAPPLPVLIETMLLSAELAAAEHQETTAVEAATAAVQLASSERIILPFIAASPRLSGVLERHPALSKLWPAPLDDSGGQGQWAPELPAEREDMALAEPLTQREVSILNWLTTTLTMAEIAAELNVSTNTVKTHVAAIYRKLEAANRREAMTRGRQLRLI